MQKIIVVVLSSVVFTGCCPVMTSHEVAPIRIGEETAVDTTGKTRKDMAKICTDRGSAFWRLPVEEQEAIAKLVFSNTRNVYNIQSIKLSLLGGEPFEIEMLLYDKYKVGAYETYEVLIFNFFRNKKREWYLSERGFIQF